MKQNHYYLLIISIFALIITSCGSSKNTAKLVKKTPVGSETVVNEPTLRVPSTLSPQSQSLLNEANQWLGTPYKYGGSTKDGVDCSGFVMQVYLSSLAIKLPRNSKEQSDYCTPANKTELIPGDLLFFGSGKTISHVGIFIGDSRMIHASTSKGVIISDINEEYYIRNFKGSGKVEKYHAMINTPKASSASPKSITAEEFAKISKATPVNAATTPISVAQTSKETNSEISAEEARKSVLNSIIEQKLDSIYGK